MRGDGRRTPPRTTTTVSHAASSAGLVVTSSVVRPPRAPRSAAGDAGLGRRVERGRRVVQDEHRRRRGERAGERDPLALPAGERAARVGQPRLEPVRQRRDDVVDRRGGDRALRGAAVVARGRGDVGAHGARRAAPARAARPRPSRARRRVEQSVSGHAVDQHRPRLRLAPRARGRPAAPCAAAGSSIAEPADLPGADVEVERGERPGGQAAQRQRLRDRSVRRRRRRAPRSPAARSAPRPAATAEACARATVDAAQPSVLKRADQELGDAGRGHQLADRDLAVAPPAAPPTSATPASATPLTSAALASKRGLGPRGATASPSSEARLATR